MKISKLLVLVAALSMAANVYAQGKVSGKVVDSKSNAPIEYATIAILHTSDSSLVSGAVSSSNGSFAIDKVPYGRYLVRVSFMGYATYYYPQPVVLSASKPSAALGKILLAPNATMMDVVEVSAERSMVEYQLDKRVINVDKNIVTGGGTATDVLENVPSVAIDNDGNVTLRGSSNVKVLINGRPYELLGNDLETLLEQIPASTVENVEVITNPSAKYDPEGMSGIINLKLKERTAGALGLNGVASLNMGTPLAFLGPNYPAELPAVIPTSMASVNLNYTTEKYNLFFTADGGMRSHGHRGNSNIERLRNGSPWSHDTINQYSVGSNRMGSVKVGGEYYFNKYNSLLLSYQLRGGSRHRNSQIFSHDLFSDGFLDYTQTDTNINNNVNHSFNASYVRKFDNPDQLLTLDATFSMRHVQGNGRQEQLYSGAAVWDNYYLRESTTENHHKGLNVKLNYTHPFQNGWRLETGYEGRSDWPNQDAQYFRTEYNPAHDLYTYFDAISSTHFYYTQHIEALYATFGGKLSEKFSAQAGLRGEYAYLFGYDLNHPATDSVRKSYCQLYPTLHLSYEINKDQSLQLSYSRRVRRPHMWDLNPYLDVREGMEMSFGNPNLDPEFTNAFELSYNFGFKTVNIFTSAYYRQTNNMMTRYGFVWDAASAAYYSWWIPYNAEYDGYWASTWQNLSTGQNYGLEFIFDWQVAKWWKINASVNLYENTIKGTALLDYKDKSAFQASGKFSSYMNLPHDWTVQLSGQYRAPWLDLQTEMFASYWVDMAVKKDLWQKRATLNLRLGDIFCTGGWGHETHTEQLNRIAYSKRISPSVTLGFTYKINNGLKPSRKQNSDFDDDGGESEY